MKKTARNNPRLAALRTLSGVLDKKLNLADADEAGNLTDARDRALARHLAYGVIRWLNSLQWLSQQLLARPLKNRDRDVSRVLLIGLYQLWQDGTAEHAAVHETAECARLLGKSWAVGLVNAVLRRFLREQQHLLEELEKHPEKAAHPQWLLSKFQADWPEDWHEIIQANNHAAPLWLRINRSQAGNTEVADRLRESGFMVDHHSIAPDAIRITPAAGVKSIPGFMQGSLSVQDPAAQLAVDLMDLQPAHRVLDACAAPGGKTCHILERFPSLELTAVEQSKSRLRMIRENFDRLGIQERTDLKLLSADAADTTAWWDGIPYDRILLDAPCTATGVIRRHPEIKWLRTAGQLEEAVILQERLLNRLWPLLNAGGILVYATCSVLVDENREQIQRFLARHDDAGPISMDASWGRDQGAGRQILPGEEEMDGFFYACLRKAC